MNTPDLHALTILAGAAADIRSKLLPIERAVYAHLGVNPGDDQLLDDFVGHLLWDHPGMEVEEFIRKVETRRPFIERNIAKGKGA